MLSLVIILLTLAAAGVVVGEWRDARRSKIEDHYLRYLLMSDLRSERYVQQIALLSSTTHKWIASRVIMELTPIIYRVDTLPLASLSSMLSLPDFLIRQASRPSPLRRLWALMLYSKLPLSSSELPRLAPFALDKDRRVRFFALMATINCDSANAVRHIASYPDTMTQFEISQLLATLTQGTLAVAYQPMLRSDSANLKLLGVAIVRHFGMESAERELRNLVAQRGFGEVRLEALYTMASMQLLISTPPIFAFVGSMSALERGRFVRYLASVGYSQRVVDSFAPAADKAHYASVVNSYKSAIRCL